MNDVHSDAFVFFGATGDLAYKKIFPALQAMAKRGHLNVPVIGVAKAGWNLDMVAIPERFQKRIGEAEKEHVVRRPFSQVMVDAEDRLLVEGAEQSLVEVLRRGEIVTERFFNDDASAVGASSFGQLFHNHPEQHRRDGEIMRRLLRRAKLLPKGLKRRRLFIVAVNIA